MTDTSSALREASIAAMPGWVDRCVRGVLGSQGIEVTDELHVAIERAGQDAQSWLAELLDPVLATNDPQHVGTPLTVVRSAARFPSAVLQSAGAAPVERDEFAQRHFPADVYDLTPASWADVDQTLVEPAIRWGAARVKAHLDGRGGA